MAKTRSIKPEAVDVQGTCVTCGERPQASRGAGKFKPYCKECINAKYPKGSVGRARHLTRCYGITDSEYRMMYADQSGCCQICKQHHDVLCVDHCHSTGRIRGLLCNNCNRAIGLLKDSVANLENAIEYLS